MCFIHYYSDRSDMSTEQAYTFDQQIYNKYILYYELIFIYRFKIIYYIPSNSFSRFVFICYIIFQNYQTSQNYQTIASELSNFSSLVVPQNLEIFHLLKLNQNQHRYRRIRQ